MIKLRCDFIIRFAPLVSSFWSTDHTAEERRLIQQLSKETYEDAVEGGGNGAVGVDGDGQRGSASRSTSLMQMRLEDLQRTLQLERELVLILGRCRGEEAI